MDDVTLHAGMIGDPDARMPQETKAQALGRLIVAMVRNGRQYGPDDIAEIIERGIRDMLAAERLRCAKAVCWDCGRGTKRYGGRHLLTCVIPPTYSPCAAAAIWALE